MGEHTGKQFVYLSQKQGRNARPERKGMGVLSQCGHPAAERSTEVIVIPSIGQAFRVFVYLWPTTSFLFSHLTGPWILPITCAQLFAEMDPSAEACGRTSIHIVRWRPLPFRPPRSLPARVQTGKFSLTSGGVILSLCFSRAQLLTLVLSLECMGENRASMLLHLTNTSCPAQGPIYLLPRL